VQIGLVDWDIAKNFGVEIALKADVRETLRALIPALKAAGGAALEALARQGIAALAPRNWTANRVKAVEKISKASDRSPIDPEWLTLQLLEAMPGNAILVDEALTSSRQVLALRPYRDRYDFHALQAASAGACRLPSAPASPILIGQWCVFPATAARCIRSRRCGLPRITSCH
jgi:benzoylformate decarboxylase